MEKRTRKPKNWIAGAVKRPGSERAAARRHGLSTMEEAKREEHSPDKKIAARGRLAERFIKGRV